MQLDLGFGPRLDWCLSFCKFVGDFESFMLSALEMIEFSDLDSQISVFLHRRRSRNLSDRISMLVPGTVYFSHTKRHTPRSKACFCVHGSFLAQHVAWHAQLLNIHARIYFEDSILG